MKFSYQFWVVALCTLMAACATSKTGNFIDKKQIRLLPAGPAWGALWQQRSAEYKALAYQSYNLARLRLDQLLNKPGGKPRAIVTDIDETVLDNSPYFVNQAEKGSVYADSTWVKWTAEMRCDTLPGAGQFLKYAQSRGVTIFYITNRFQRERLATLANLQKFDLPNADTAHLFLLKSINSSKESRRQTIMKDFEVLLLLGDNLGDFSSLFDDLTDFQRNGAVHRNKSLFGERFIVFPNAMYGKWEDIFYPKMPISVNSKNKLLSNALRH